VKLLENKVAVITGGTRGLGLAIAHAYTAEGAAVVIAGRTQATIDTALASLRSGGAQVAGFACDVSDFKQVEALGAFAAKTFGKIDIWVNNAGLSAPYGPTVSVPTASYMRVINTNIIGVYNGSMIALRHMVPNHSGKLINLLGSGDNKLKGTKYQNAYCPSKIWVRSFTSALAQENKETGIDILAFNPGLVDTDMLRHVEAVSGFEQKMKPLETVIRLWGNKPEVPAQKALWLASRATDGKNGMAYKVLTTQRMMGGLFRELGRRLTNKPAPDTSLDIHTIVADQGI
jgi:NAD(P)-dependent dehydrogenase (short-subunit alcohol dehydrogenase family)